MTLDRGTLVPLGLLIAVVLSAIGGTWQVGSVMSTFSGQLADQRHEFSLRFQSLEIQLKQLQASTVTDRWHRSDMREWSSLLQSQNPDLQVPKVNR